jgi:hypothetical protein
MKWAPRLHPSLSATEFRRSGGRRTLRRAFQLLSLIAPALSSLKLAARTADTKARRARERFPPMPLSIPDNRVQQKSNCQPNSQPSAPGRNPPLKSCENCCKNGDGAQDRNVDRTEDPKLCLHFWITFQALVTNGRQT